MIETYVIYEVLRDLYGDPHKIILEIFRQEHLAWNYLEEKKQLGAELILIKKTEILLDHANKEGVL